MNKRKTCIVGTGGFAREVLVLIDDLNNYGNMYCFLEPDDIWEKHWKDKCIMGKPVLPFSSFKKDDYVASIAIGDSTIREKCVKELPIDTDYINLIHPKATVSRWSTIDQGVIITAGTIITCNVNIGAHAHLNLNTTIGHDCEIGNFFTSAPSVNISGNCTIKNRVYFGTQSATKQGIEICDDVIIGMGAMVVKDISNPGTYVGIPAKLR